MIKTIYFLHQLPQNLLGLLVYLINRKSVKKQYNLFADCSYYTAKHVSDTGISLGNYIFLDCDKTVTLNSIKHEKGHQKQSLYLGWLYLIVVGIPSIIVNVWNRLFHKDWSVEERVKWYYSQYPENWADRLGGVQRQFR